MRNGLFLALLFLAAPVFGQLQPHTLTITASRSITLQPDQVALGVVVNSPGPETLDQIVSALAGAGITSANLSSSYSDPPMVQWNFSLTAPLANLTTMIGSLAKLQQTIGQNNSGLTMIFNVNGIEVSQQLQQSQTCSNSDLVSDATAQAQKLAAAAGLSLGPIMTVSNISVSQPGVAERLGELYPGATAVLVPVSVFNPASASFTCSLYVQFRLLP